MTDPHGSAHKQGERTTLWIIRHGKTEWSAVGRHTGRTDIPLTPEGERQSVALGRYLNGRSFALVLCSPLRRARETCRLAGYQDVASVTDDLQEWDYGAYEGRTTSEIRTEAPGWSIWTGRVPDGETLEQVSGRAERVIQRAVASGGEVALFAHAHILRVLTARWLGLPPDAGRFFSLSPASVSVLGYEREIRVITLWNQEWHHT
ncbi:MAG: histidine phosphatase family protein [Nitrospirota bacterium]